MAKFIIREARREDCAEILRLVRELANFENLPDGPKIGADILARDGFDNPHPVFKCFVAELEPSAQQKNETATNDHTSVDEKLVGYALFYPTYSTWDGPTLYLEDIYVSEECRSMGIGSALFDRVVKEASDKNYARLDFTVLNWNPATEFYKRKGAIDLTTSGKWHHYRMEKNAIDHLMALKKSS